MFCPDCTGVGRNSADPWSMCRRCDGVGHVWRPGGPLFGCKMVLGDQHVGEIVTVGTGERGRITRVGERWTFVALIDDWTDTQDSVPTVFPSETGVSSVSDPRWNSDNRADTRVDVVDPLQRKRLM